MEVLIKAEDKEQAENTAYKLVNIKQLPEELGKKIFKWRYFEPKLEATENPHGKCPNCGSNLIDQEHCDSGDNHTWYHCYKCGRWYNEEGELDTEE